jgi:isomerase DpgB
MVTAGRMFTDVDVAAGSADVLTARIDGTFSLSPEPIAAIADVCDRAEDLRSGAIVVVHLTGAPQGAWASDLTVKLVSSWEQTLRRLERIPAATIAVVTGDCGGPALDVLLATDHRIAAEPARLILPVQDGMIWPGMALYRLARQLPNGVVRHAALFGGALSADEALALHVIHEVAEDVHTALAAVVRRVSTMDGTELAVRRQLALEAQTAGFEDALGLHLAACDRALRRAAAWTSS